MAKISKTTIQHNILCELIAAGGFEWPDLVRKITDAEAAPDNWLKVRGLLQAKLNAGEIVRDPNLHIEKYNTVSAEVTSHA